jgi:Zn-dependent protease with chaperone function
LNFFEAQDRARRTTRWLVVVYVVATVLIVAGVTLVVGAALYLLGSPAPPPDHGVLLATAALATLLIVGSTLYRTAALSAGGSRVATEMGGTPVPPDVQDPLRRRLRNIVEEMSIASGVPVPDIYVLEAEDGINAFAAGYTPGDAAIAVTRGALDVLDRDELQGVIAHEFSHILNGDMRINIRMMGVLFGIMVLSIIGRIVLRGGYHSGAMSSRRNRGAPAVMVVGAGLVLLGWIGVLFARVIKSAVSRQRETLADASAVQFTRQTRGLADALKKIGGYSQQSYLRAVDPEEISHMLFARGSRRLTSLFATHPPLVERIRALDPSFREEDFRNIAPQPEGRQPSLAGEFTDASGYQGAAVAAAAASVASASPAATAGNPDIRQIGFAHQLRQSIPTGLYDAAHGEATSFLLTLALVLDRTGRHLERQLHLLEGQLGRERTSLVRRYYEQLLDAGAAYSLPLLELAFPALKRRPAAQLQFLVDLVRRLVETDGEADLFEYCFYRVLLGTLRQAGNPARSASTGASRRAARRAALQLIRIVANHGHDDPASREAAWRAGIGMLGSWASHTEFEPSADGDSDTVAGMDRNLDVLRQIDLSGREKLINALSATIGHDNSMTLIEAELMRAICAGLDCPLPPLITDNPLAPTDLVTATARQKLPE